MLSPIRSALLLELGRALEAAAPAAAEPGAWRDARGFAQVRGLATRRGRTAERGRALTASALARFSTALLLAFSAGHDNAAAAVLEVPSPTYPSIQSALDAAVSTAEDDEVRIQAGVYRERLDIPSTLTTGSLHVSGGWNASFSVQEDDPRET
jgi:pectin methylesterase-like acyl-CoA thioesterase